VCPVELRRRFADGSDPSRSFSAGLAELMRSAAFLPARHRGIVKR
jgi:hypothetical protein